MSKAKEFVLKKIKEETCRLKANEREVRRVDDHMFPMNQMDDIYFLAKQRVREYKGKIEELNKTLKLIEEES